MRATGQGLEKRGKMTANAGRFAPTMQLFGDEATGSCLRGLRCVPHTLYPLQDMPPEAAGERIMACRTERDDGMAQGWHA